MNDFSKVDRALLGPIDLSTDDRRRLPVLAPSPVPASADDHAPDDHAPDERAPESLLQIAQRQGKRLLAGWATSLLLHLFLLMLLTLYTFGNASSKLGLELAFSDSVEAIDFQEVQFEMPALDESDLSQDMESLLAPEEQADDPALELPELAIEPVAQLESLFADSMIESGSLSSSADEPMSDSEFGGMVGADAGSTKSGAKFYGINTEGNRFVYVIDASTSMNDDGRWGRAVDELLESISQLKASQKFLVLTYSSSFRPMMDMPMNQIDLVRATRGNKRRLADWIRRLQPNGVTMPSGAMMVGLSLNVDAIFLLSDGLLMDRTDSMLRQHNRPRLLRFGGGRKTPVHTIAMDVAGDGADLLRVIAEENAGHFRVVQ